MRVVTFTTDFGYKDFYAGYLKGKILSYAVPVNLVDISHGIEAFNIAQAAFTLKNVYKAFPKGTIHVISVNNFYDSNPRFLVVQQDGQYFICADNGIFSILFDEVPEYMYEISNPETINVQNINDFFAKIAGHILQVKDVYELGSPSNKRVQRIGIQPIIGKNHIRGSVVHVDVFGNVILNVDRVLFDRIGQGKPFELYFKRFDPISSISTCYSEQLEGEFLCLFNSSGLLEIAVNMGNASELSGLGVDDVVQIDFNE
jgi:S-adenosylmethionine hydrolase